MNIDSALNDERDKVLRNAIIIIFTKKDFCSTSIFFMFIYLKIVVKI